MKKMILTLGLLVCGSVAYGMDNDMNTAIAQADWNQVATILQNTGEHDSQLTHHIAALSSTDTTLLNQAGKDGKFLLPILILRACDGRVRPSMSSCGKTFKALIDAYKLTPTTKDGNGNLVCNADYLDFDCKLSFLYILGDRWSSRLTLTSDSNIKLIESTQPHAAVDVSIRPDDATPLRPFAKETGKVTT